MSLTGKPQLTTTAPVENDGFWPQASMADLMGKYRIPAETPSDTIKWALVLAIVRVNAALDGAKSELITMGYTTFAAYLTANPSLINNAELMQVHYEHAIYARTKAMLLQQFKTMNRRDNAENMAKESAETEQYWLDESQQSIAAIQSAVFPLESFSAKANSHVALI